MSKYTITYYMLDQMRHVVTTNDVVEWGKWFQGADRKVAHAEIDGLVVVSTVFLGLDHRWSGKGPPLLFETMVFGESYMHPKFKMLLHEDLGDCQRYCFWQEAVDGHQVMVRKWERKVAAARRLADRVQKNSPHLGRNPK